MIHTHTKKKKADTMISIMTRASFNNNLSCWFIKAYRVKENKKKKSRRIQIQKAQDQYRHQEKLRKKKKKRSLLHCALLFPRTSVY